MPPGPGQCRGHRAAAARCVHSRVPMGAFTWTAQSWMSSPCRTPGRRKANGRTIGTSRAIAYPPLALAARALL
eukprot:8498697-Alexandrium_andersonii.AAC.1